MSRNLLIGDAVVPELAPDVDVMTVYDFEVGMSIALCNWVVGTRMFKAKYPVASLVKLERRPNQGERA